LTGALQTAACTGAACRGATAKECEVTIREGRFGGRLGGAFEKMNASIDFDGRLFREDIRGSIAYARALYKRGVLSPAEQKAVIDGLKRIEREMEEGGFEFRLEDEDIHMNVERRLRELIGETAHKLHTGRSRNEQVVLDERLYLMGTADGIERLLLDLCFALFQKAKLHLKTIVPSYTHLRQAQPISLAHLFLAYREALQRDRERLQDFHKRLGVMPLGSGAAAGSTIGIDRGFLAEELGFGACSRNSIDAVSTRDFLAEFQFICAGILITLSRMSEDFILFSADEIGFYSVPDELATSSSLMPQKKNPDSLELIRGKSARVIGNLLATLTLMKGLPYTYNRDLQEDKERLFDTADTVSGVLEVMSEAVRGLRVNPERIDAVLKGSGGFLFATDLADYLVGKGVFFRTAHQVVGSIVRFALTHGKGLLDLTLEELRSFHKAFDEDVFSVFDYERSVNNHDVPGGTAFGRIQEELDRIQKEP
jgi:argininosuccinate lyase